MAFDFKKEYKEYYMPKNKPEIVTVPMANCYEGRFRVGCENCRTEEKDGLLIGRISDN